jgi:hypothetical protein
LYSHLCLPACWLYPSLRTNDSKQRLIAAQPLNTFRGHINTQSPSSMFSNNPHSKCRLIFYPNEGEPVNINSNASM